MERRYGLDAIQYLMDVDPGSLNRGDRKAMLGDPIQEEQAILKKHIERKQTELRALEGRLFDLEQLANRDRREEEQRPGFLKRLWGSSR
ncbi:MAG: hypothetical protein JNN08_03585 [Bryobacterales bacterium]|nr:hypothetical protein [Bryobacterales bacterium]